MLRGGRRRWKLERLRYVHAGITSVPASGRYFSLDVIRMPLIYVSLLIEIQV